MKPLYYFPRGDGPLVSVLLPTRGRPALLRQAIDSCHSLAKDPSLIEYILKIDDDDDETRQVAEWLGTVLPCRTIVSPRGNGFYDMHHWVNQMGRFAYGDWLFLFNDDARMQTQDWDQVLLTACLHNGWVGITQVCGLCFPTIGRPFAQEFICLRKKTFDLLGHWSFSPHNDNWIWSILSFLNCAAVVKIEIEHFSEKMEDDTRKESEGAYPDTIHSLTSLRGKKLRTQDVRVLLAHLEFLYTKLAWLETPGWPGWWWLETPGRPVHQTLITPDGQVHLFNDRAERLTQPLSEVRGRWAVME